MNDQPFDFWGTLTVIGAAVTGVAARLSHTFVKRKEDADAAGTTARRITLGEMVAALVAAPALGLIAGAIGRWQEWNIDIQMGLAGFAGLSGPAALLAFWDKAADPLLNFLRAKTGGRR